MNTPKQCLVLKLVSGEDLVADCTNLDEPKFVTLIDPVVMEVRAFATGEIGLMMTKFCPYRKSDVIDVAWDKILTWSTVPEHVEKYYRKNIEYLRTCYEPSIQKSIEEATQLVQEAIDRRKKRDSAPDSEMKDDLYDLRAVAPGTETSQ